MGPCFISTEDRRGLLAVVNSRRGFNGAVLHQHGRHRLRCRATSRLWPASMGPCFISTEDLDAVRATFSRLSSASMGPCFISTEDRITLNQT